MQWRPIALGLGLTVLVSTLVTAYAVWQDGAKFAATVKTYRPAAASVERPGYVDSEQFYWKTAEQLRGYVRRQRDAIFKEVGIGQTP